MPNICPISSDNCIEIHPHMSKAVLTEFATIAVIISPRSAIKKNLKNTCFMDALLYNLKTKKDDSIKLKIIPVKYAHITEIV